MILKVTYSQKCGRPEFLSESAGVELCLDVSEKTVSESPASLVDEIRRGFELCRAEVLRQLHQGEHQVEPPDRQPVVVSRGNGVKEGPGERIPARQPTRRAADPEDDLPGDARQLAAWGRKVDAGPVPGYWKALCAMGRENGWDGRVVAWDNEQVDAAVDLYREMASQPAPAPRNGAYTNGHASNGYPARCR